MLDGQEKEALGNVIEDSLLAPTSTEDVPRTLRKFKRTRTISYGQEDLVDACEEGMVDDVDGDVCFDDVVLDSEEIIISGARAIFSWFQNFQPSCDKIEFLVALVRFPKLPLEYYTVMAILRIVSCVGRVIRIDRNTEDVQRGGFARVCIDLDLTKPLCSLVSLRKHDMGRFFALNHAADDSGNNDKTKFEATLKDFVKHNKSGFKAGMKKRLETEERWVHSNHVPSPSNDVGKLASFVVLKDMATSSMGLVCNESSLISFSANNVTFGGCVGVFRGIWTLWKSSVGSVEVVCRSRQFISLIIDDGKRFTWSNGQYVHGLIRKKLDKALCNVAWRQTFEDVVVRNLSRSHSNHYPVVVIDNLLSFCIFPHDHEIHASLKSMAQWKSFGPDGFQAGFYQLFGVMVLLLPFGYDRLGNGSIMENFAVDVSPEFHHLNFKDVVVDPSSYKELVDALPVEVRGCGCHEETMLHVLQALWSYHLHSGSGTFGYLVSILCFYFLAEMVVEKQGSQHVTKVELYAIYNGLRLAWEHGIRNLIIASDSLVFLVHTYREANMRTDFLASCLFNAF
ncbi:hypothetical protein Goshw_011619 [Gossypium schwendimanii]|uniref:RNase H type-1 domain-containing protein n=1 Tax=Gossypium schwendimanii TaxID=34291 RepID=A0A7J9N1Z7_GOSSC|nr:hypothetical protein [Gossypium schwendimanii]